MDIPSKNKPAAGRYALLDELRGLDLLSMIGYHACWDLIFLFGMSAAWYTGWQGHLWQQSICWVFILLSGFCLPLGHRPLRPWLFLFWAGYFLHFCMGRARMEPLRRSVCAPLGWLGRHSLGIYLLHQPVIYGVLLLLFHIFEQ